MELYFEDCKKIEAYMDEEGNVFFNALDLGCRIPGEPEKGVDYWACIQKHDLLGGK